MLSDEFKKLGRKVRDSEGAIASTRGRVRSPEQMNAALRENHKHVVDLAESELAGMTGYRCLRKPFELRVRNCSEIAGSDRNRE